jgi:hypothetical protein
VSPCVNLSAIGNEAPTTPKVDPSIVALRPKRLL